MLHLQPRARTLHMRIKSPAWSAAVSSESSYVSSSPAWSSEASPASGSPAWSSAVLEREIPIPHLRLPGAPKLHLQARALMLRLHLRGALKLHPRARPRMLGLQLSRARAPTLHPHPASPLMPGPQRSRARPPTLHTQARPSTLHLARFTYTPSSAAPTDKYYPSASGSAAHVEPAYGAAAGKKAPVACEISRASGSRLGDDPVIEILVCTLLVVVRRTIRI